MGTSYKSLHIAYFIQLDYCFLVQVLTLINPLQAEEFSSRIQKLANPGSATDRELTGLGIWMS